MPTEKDMLRHTKKKIKKCIGIILTIIILSYSIFEVKDLARGPSITVDYPENGATVNVGVVSLRGTAERISSIQINGGELFTDLTGRFTKDILLSPGYNVIDVRAQDRLGRHVEKKIELVAQTVSSHDPVARLPASVNNY